MRYLGKNGWTPRKFGHLGKLIGRLLTKVKPTRLSRREANRAVVDGRTRRPYKRRTQNADFPRRPTIIPDFV